MGESADCGGFCSGRGEWVILVLDEGTSQGREVESIRVVELVVFFRLEEMW